MTQIFVTTLSCRFLKLSKGLARNLIFLEIYLGGHVESCKVAALAMSHLFDLKLSHAILAVISNRSSCDFGVTRVIPIPIPSIFLFFSRIFTFCHLFNLFEVNNIFLIHATSSRVSNGKIKM